MLQVARLAPKLLGEEAAALVAAFLRSRQNEDGGFNDRAGNSDLYYTVFALEGLLALRAFSPSPGTPGAGRGEGCSTDQNLLTRAATYLDAFQGGAALDFIHLSCLARCHAALAQLDAQHLGHRARPPADAILAHVEKYRAQDNAYDTTPSAQHGSLYGCFLALGAYEDLGRPVPDPDAMLACAEKLRTPDGGYANDLGLPLGLTPSTAAAATLIRHLGQTPPPDVAAWLLARHHPQGGFFATPDAPIPDLLSTATALHALAGLHADLTNIKEPCLDFLDTLWTNQGAFYGQWADTAADAEYTFYALLALGHLSIW
jgi:hypothetical protein